jgi:Ca-activated chloride channel family protein
MSSGMDFALDLIPRQAEPARMHRVLLLSDGLANEGDASREGLLRRARTFTRHGAVLTSMGIGDDFDESLMAALSDAGEGNFYYLARLEALPGFFAAEFDAAARTVASNLEVHFVPGAFVKLIDASGYPLERNAGEVSFRPGALYAGQKRSIWLSMQVPTERLERFSLGSLRLSYTAADRPHELSAAIAPEVECVADSERFENGIVKEVWEAAVSRDAASKTQRVLAEAVASGSAADVDRAAAAYTNKNQALAAKLKSSVVQQSIDDVQKRAQVAKQAQNESAPQRHVASKRMKARSSFLERKDAYSADPMLGM